MQNGSLLAAWKRLKTTELGENANSKTAMIFLGDHDKLFLKFHVQLTPHHVTGKKAEATTQGFTDICDIINREAKRLQEVEIFYSALKNLSFVVPTWVLRLP